MQLQLEKKEPNQTQQTTEQPPRPGLSSPSAAVPLPARSPRRGGLRSAADKMLASTSWAVNHRILSQRCTGWGRQKAGACWRSDRRTELCKSVEFQSYEFLVILKTPLSQNPQSWLDALPAGPGAGARGCCGTGDTHHAPTGAVQKSPKCGLGHFLPMLALSSPADGSQDSHSCTNCTWPCARNGCCSSMLMHPYLHPRASAVQTASGTEHQVLQSL